MADCEPTLVGIARASSQIVAWGQSCATQGKGVLEWFAPPSHKSQRQELSETFDAQAGTVTPVGNGIIVRPTGDAGHRFSYAGGRWVRDDAPPSLPFGQVRERFEQAGLAFADAYDAPDGGVLVLSLCHPRTSRNEDVPTCAYRATGVIPSGGAPDSADGGTKGASGVPPSDAAPAKPIVVPKERGNK